MDVTSQLEWHPLLRDPTGRRTVKPRTRGQTMVIDKGLGLHAFEDLLQTSAPYIDLLKIGFGTTPLYPTGLLKRKIELARQHQIAIMPGGTFLEVAVSRHTVPEYFDMIGLLGFTAIEVSDGTIEMERTVRNELIRLSREAGLTVYTEYGKKLWGSTIDAEELVETVLLDVQHGAALVTIEARESGAGVGIFDANGECRDEELLDIVGKLPEPDLLLWEAPQKQQQVHLLKTLGSGVNLGNISPNDIFSLESLRRGLRSDTFGLELSP
ncbi:phosphosulfolactate synthase [Paenibacillus flagellatus]|uniref:Phosphosulfolactate synthase n=1 Tax=Paenibacillus flagellatus TaxID=2211139 RepID=A0A2V5KYL0_9BACL|nr:phosphosulfolactate synthase [Paenibacillus flagellatus]PYI55066.1 phosphosulfolactate synthase [Paenibacillus flagellatus]